MKTLPRLWQDWGIRTATPSEVIAEWHAPLTPTLSQREREEEVFDAHSFISWADIERDLSAWRGNHIQEAAFRGLYALEERVKEAADPLLLALWRKLQTSDHFY